MNNQLSGLTPHASRLTRQPSPLARLGFTLIEMLVVTAIIAILAALIFPVAAVVKRKRDLTRTRTELMLVSQAIQGYQQKLGHYPPDNAQSTDPLRYQHNLLFYELRGTIKVSTNGVPAYPAPDPGPPYFLALDGSCKIPASVLSGTFGTGGIINSTQGAGGDEAQPASKFLTEVKAGQYVDANVNGTSCRMLGCALDNPNAVTDSAGRRFSPWCYNSSSPTNNPNSFDLWVDVQEGSKIYRIGNWSTSFQVLN